MVKLRSKASTALLSAASLGLIVMILVRQQEVISEGIGWINMTLGILGYPLFASAAVSYLFCLRWMVSPQDRENRIKHQAIRHADLTAGLGTLGTFVGVILHLTYGNESSLNGINLALYSTAIGIGVQKSVIYLVDDAPTERPKLTGN